MVGRRKERCPEAYRTDGVDIVRCRVIAKNPRAKSDFCAKQYFCAQTGRYEADANICRKNRVMDIAKKREESDSASAINEPDPENESTVSEPNADALKESPQQPESETAEEDGWQ